MSPSRCGRVGSNVGLARSRSDGERNFIAHGRQLVFARPREVYHQAGDRRNGLIQPVAHRLHSILTDGDVALVRARTGAGKIKQHAFGCTRRAHFWSHRPAEHNLHLHLRPVVLNRYVLDDRIILGSRRYPGHRRQQEQEAVAYVYSCPHTAAPLSASSLACRHNWTTLAHFTPPLLPVSRTSVATLP